MRAVHPLKSLVALVTPLLGAFLLMLQSGCLSDDNRARFYTYCDFSGCYQCDAVGCIAQPGRAPGCLLEQSPFRLVVALRRSERGFALVGLLGEFGQPFAGLLEVGAQLTEFTGAPGEVREREGERNQEPGDATRFHDGGGKVA